MKLDQIFSCPMKWDKMPSLDERTKFCHLCTKKIHDFSKASDEEIREVIGSQKSVCAKVPANRLNEWITPFQKVLAAIVFCFAGTLFTVEFAHGQKIEVAKIESRQIKKLQGRVIDDLTLRPVANARITYSMKKQEYEIYTDSIGQFAIELPQEYVALNLNIYYEGKLKTKHFEEEMYTYVRNTGDIKISAVDSKKGMKWISGTVIEHSTQETMPFVNIEIPEIEVRVATDINGKFKIPYWENLDSLTIRASFIGYEQRILKLSTEENLEELPIELEDAEMTLGIVIVSDDINYPTIRDLNSNPDPMNKNQNQVNEGVHRNGQTWILNRRDF